MAGTSYLQNLQNRGRYTERNREAQGKAMKMVMDSGERAGDDSGAGSVMRELMTRMVILMEVLVKVAGDDSRALSTYLVAG